MPADLDIVILRPPGSEGIVEMNRQFRGRFRIRRAIVLMWLQFLKDRHPGYSDMVLSDHNLSQLPEDDSVLGQLTTQEFEASTDVLPPPDAGPVGEDVAEEGGKLYNEAAIPNILIEESEMAQLQGRVQGTTNSHSVLEQPPLERQQPDAAHQIQMPSIRHTPLNEFNRSQCLLSLACPSIFPQGMADFAYPREREISYQDYLEHAMKWEDGRFARHYTF